MGSNIDGKVDFYDAHALSAANAMGVTYEEFTKKLEKEIEQGAVGVLGVYIQTAKANSFIEAYGGRVGE